MPRFVWNPFGNEMMVNGVPIYDAGAPRLTSGTLAVPLSPVWVIGWFGYLNWVLMVANLMPALPFDYGTNGPRAMAGRYVGHAIDEMASSPCVPGRAASPP